MHKLFLILFFLGMCIGCAAQDTEYYDSVIDNSIDEEIPVEDIIVPDTTLITSVKNVTSEKLHEIRNKEDFRYMENIDSILRAMQDENLAKQRKNSTPSFLENLINAPILQILFWSIAGFVLVLLIMQFITRQGLFKSKPTSSEVEEKEDVEKIYTHADYEKLAHAAKAKPDFRLAVKYLFLGTLQNLSENSQIEFAADKTNYRYLQEIDQSKRNEFARLILNYEYVWYGKRQISGEIFNNLEQEFAEFNAKI